MVRIIPLILALAAAPAFGQTAPAATAAPADPAARAGKPPAPMKDRMICRTLEETGTRLGGKRVCMPASQWQEQQRLQRQEVEEQQR